MKALEKEIDAIQDQIEALEDEIDLIEESKEPINDKIDAINEEIDAIQKQYDERKKALELAKKEADFREQMHKSEIDYYDALARGDFAGAAKIQSDMDQQRRDYEHDATMQQLQDEEDAAVEAKEKQIEALEDQIEALDERIKAIQDKIDLKQDEIDAINDVKEAAAEAHEAAMEARAEELERLQENRDAAIAAEKEKQEAEAARIKESVRQSQERTAKIIELMNQEAEQGRLSMDDVKKYAGQIASDVGNALGWNATDIAAYAVKLTELMTEQYADSLNELGIKAEDYGRWAAENNRKSDAVEEHMLKSHTGEYIGRDSKAKNGLKPDETPRVLQAGEWVIRKEAVRKYGTDHFDALNKMKMHTGGQVGLAGTKTGNLPSHVGVEAQHMSMMHFQNTVPDLTKPLFDARAAAIKAEIDKFKADQATRAAQQGIVGPEGTPAMDGAWALPLRRGSYTVTSEFSAARKNPVTGKVSPHYGIDLAASSGTPVYSAQSGKIIEQGTIGYAGNNFRIQHGDGWQTRYLHLSAFVAKLGDIVKKGQLIGKVGTTGRSTGPHLHFETKPNGGSPVDPRNLLSFRNGGDVLKDNVLANLHNRETVLSAPLSTELKEGISKINSVPGTIERGESPTEITYGDTHFNIEVHAQPGQDAEHIANAVFSKIRQKEARLGIRS